MGRRHNAAGRHAQTTYFFTEKLISHLSAEFCIDTSKIFAIGASNGGMFVHHIAKALPNTFRAVMPIYGLPLIGRGLQPAGLASTSFLSLHDRWDNVIPIEGGLSSQGWRYESLAAVLANWTQLHGCGKTHASAVPRPTPFDAVAAPRGLNCFECHLPPSASARTLLLLLVLAPASGLADSTLGAKFVCAGMHSLSLTTLSYYSGTWDARLGSGSFPASLTVIMGIGWRML